MFHLVFLFAPHSLFSLYIYILHSFNSFLSFSLSFLYFTLSHFVFLSLTPSSSTPLSISFLLTRCLCHHFSKFIPILYLSFIPSLSHTLSLSHSLSLAFVFLYFFILQFNSFSPTLILTLYILRIFKCILKMFHITSHEHFELFF